MLSWWLSVLQGTPTIPIGRYLMYFADAEGNSLVDLSGLILSFHCLKISLACRFKDDTRLGREVAAIQFP